MSNPRIAHEHTFCADDGTEIFYRHWPSSAQAGSKRAILLFHRGHEHSGRLQDAVDGLDLPEYDCFAWDARGLGRSPGVRGHAEHFGVYAKDADRFARHLCQAHGLDMANIAVIAQSLGGVIASAWVHDYAPDIRCLVLVSPALKVKLYVPFARFFLKLSQQLGLTRRFPALAFVNSYVQPQWLTQDAARIISYRSDPLITRPIAVNILLDLYETAERLVQDAAAITTPTQFLVSGSDWVVHQQPMRQMYRALGADNKEYHVFDGFRHDTLGEKDRHLPLAAARRFITEQFAREVVPADLRQADRGGFTFDEAARLQRPLSWLHPKAWYFALTRLNIQWGSRVAKGLQLGVHTGFDSGATLDYVYQNHAQGSGWLGRSIDRTYLNAIGWRGIRIRKPHILRLMAQAASRLRTESQPVRILDIAAGHGRYALEAALAARAEHVTLRDYREANVQAGRVLITSLGLQQVAEFELADAFDAGSFNNLNPRPTLAVVSGLYELFADNTAVAGSLAGIHQALLPGGYLVYTNQPWHPQLELIARTLTSHRQHRAWIMRRRTQREMDQLVTAAGFDKVDQYVDRWGIFTVSLAKRR